MFRTILRVAAAPAIIGLSLFVGSNVQHTDVAHAESHFVYMIDNPATNPTAADPRAGLWGYGPHHISVVKGDTIEFFNPSTNRRPHTVTSITYDGPPATGNLLRGAAFDSSPGGIPTVIMPGNSWTLDTTDMAPGHYTYYCWLHLWMVGTFTVEAP